MQRYITMLIRVRSQVTAATFHDRFCKFDCKEKLVRMIGRWLVWYWQRTSPPNWHERNATGTTGQRKGRLQA